MPFLYDAVAFGMASYTRTAFRVKTLGREWMRLRAGTIIASTHRRETDVPLVCPSLYYLGGLWADRRQRMSFSARDDMFEPGFFAGFPPSLPPLLRTALFRIDIGEIMQRNLQVHPIRSATVIRLYEVFRQVPDLELDAVLAPETANAFRSRAAALGLPRPVLGAEVLRGEFADLLWGAHSREALDGPALDPVWRRRAALATGDFRALVDHVRRGAVLLVFPEGRPSPDGELGPLRAGLEALIRRGRPAWLQPVGIAYDPLVRGRTRAYVSFGRPVEPPAEAVEREVLRLLRHATPLTVGQVVAHALLAGGSPHAELDDAVEAARAEARNVEPELLRPEIRRRRVDEALARAERGDVDLAYLAREYESALGRER